MVSENKARIFRNVLITSAGKYGEYILALISSAIVARALGADNYGIYAFTVFISGWMIRLSNISLPTTAIRFVAESRGKKNEAVSRRISARLLTRQTINSLIVCSLFIAGIQIYQPEVLKGQGNFLFLLVCIAVFFKARYGLLIAIAKGYERFDVEATTAIVVGVLSVASMIYMAVIGASIANFFLVFCLACVAMAILSSYLCRSKAIRHERGTIDSDYLKKITRYRRLTTLLGLVGLVGGHTVEVFLLGQYGTNIEIGYFGLSIALTRGLTDLCTVGLTMVLMPSLAHAFGEENLKAVQKIFLESTRYYVFFGVGLGLSGFFVADPVIKILFGVEFQDAAWVLSSLLFISGYGMAGAAIGAYLSTTDRQDIRVKFSISVVCVQITLAFLLVPRLGLEGAIASSAITSLFSLILGYQWIARNMEAGIPYKLYSKIILAGILSLLPTVVIVYFTDSLIFDVTAILLFAVLYVYLTILFKCWWRDDLDLVRYAVGMMPRFISNPITNLLNKY